MVKNEKMVSPEPFFSWAAVRRQRLQPPCEQPPRLPDLYVDEFLHWQSTLIVSSLVCMRRNMPQNWCFFIYFHNLYNEKNDVLSAWRAPREIRHFEIEINDSFYFAFLIFWICSLNFLEFWCSEKDAFSKKEWMQWKNEWMVKNEKMVARGPFVSS